MDEGKLKMENETQEKIEIEKPKRLKFGKWEWIMIGYALLICIYIILT